MSAREKMIRMLDKFNETPDTKWKILAGALEGLAGEVRSKGELSTRIQRSAWLRTLVWLQGEIS